jgi:6-phosphogluconolactonase
MKKQCVIGETVEQIYARLFDHFMEITGKVIADKGVMTCALSGGRSPLGFYRKLASVQDRQFWSKIHFFVVDERYVPFIHPDSNFGMLKRELFSCIPIPQENLHPMPTSFECPQMAAECYEAELRDFFKLDEGGFPECDFMLLGMGRDGHTASLFPETPQLAAADRLVVDVDYAKVPQSRLSLTLPVINHSQEICFLVLGQDKASMVKEVVDGGAAGQVSPAALVRPKSGNLTFFLDRPAASRLS